MTDAELRIYLIEWAASYCHTAFEENDLPGGVEIFLDRAADFIKSSSGKTSESLGDYSVSFSQEIPPTLTSLLEPYKKVTFV